MRLIDVIYYTKKKKKKGNNYTECMRRLQSDQKIINWSSSRAATDKYLASFQSSKKFSQNISFENNFCIPYLGKESHHFANRLSALIKVSCFFHCFCKD